MPSPKEIVLAYADAFNRADLDGLCNLFAPDAEIWGVFGKVPLDQARALWKDYIDSLQIHFQVDGLIAEGNTVAVRFTETGKSVRPFRGTSPTGKSYELVVLEWFEIEANRIRRRWAARDIASEFRQLGFNG